MAIFNSYVKLPEGIFLFWGLGLVCGLGVLKEQPTVTNVVSKGYKDSLSHAFGMAELGSQVVSHILVEAYPAESRFFLNHEGCFCKPNSKPPIAEGL